MTDNKNMLKKTNRADKKVVANKRYYGIVEYSISVFDEKGKKKTVNKSGVLKLDEKMTRMQANNEIKRMVKSMGGKLIYFGAFKNQ